MNRKKIQKSIYFTASIGAVLVFILGILLGNFITETKLSSIGSLQNQLYTDTLGLDVEFQLLAGQQCEYFNRTVQNEDLYLIGARLASLEGQLGQNDKRVLNLKEFYNVLEIRQILLTEQVNERCETDKKYVIYFYAIDELCDDCEDQGNVLTYWHDKYSTFTVYSIDANIQNPAVRALRELYGVTYVPSTVIGGETYLGLQNRDRLEELFTTNGYFNTNT